MEGEPQLGSLVIHKKFVQIDASLVRTANSPFWKASSDNKHIGLTPVFYPMILLMTNNAFR